MKLIPNRPFIVATSASRTPIITIHMLAMIVQIELDSLNSTLEQLTSDVDILMILMHFFPLYFPIFTKYIWQLATACYKNKLTL